MSDSEARSPDVDSTWRGDSRTPWDRAWQSLRDVGVSRTARRAWHAALTRLREHHLGIETAGSIHARELGNDEPSFGYQPISYESFFAAMRLVPIRVGQDVFVDYGCGKGRAVIAAAKFPFRRVVGVERSAELVAAGWANLDRARRRLRCPDVTIVHADAREYEPPDDASVLFFFNPFDGTVMQKVLSRVVSSMARRPRTVHCIYSRPQDQLNAMLACDRLELAHRVPTPHPEWEELLIYRCR